MGSHRQSRQVVDVTWEHSPSLPWVTQVPLAPSTVAVRSPISACGGWLLLTLRSMIKVRNK